MVRNFDKLVSLSLLTLLSLSPLAADFNPIERISTTITGSGQPNGLSSSPSVSTDTSGRYVAFTSSATNLTGDDSEANTDLFLFDRNSSLAIRVSQATGGGQADGDSSSPSISGDGNLVVFSSTATNLVSGDTNSVSDVFLYDFAGDSITKISEGVSNTQADGSSTSPVISQDGNYIAYASAATNIVSGDSNGRTDIFLYDRVGDTTIRVSESSADIQGDGNSENPAIDSDGSTIVYQSVSTNLVTGDTNSNSDIFIYDRAGDTTTIASTSTADIIGDAASSNPTISHDGTVVAFESVASNLITGDSNGVTDIFLHTISTGETERVSISDGELQSNGDSTSPALDETGQFVTFESEATNLVSGDSNDNSDIFVRDTTNDSTTRVSVSANSVQANGASQEASLSENGHYIAFSSFASDLIDSDSNGNGDVYLINTQCLLSLTGVTELDTDGDGTTDCSDDCPEDSSKTTGGVCGCGTADVDSDGDGTLDCLEDCPSDPNKTDEGDCGCGEVDEDLNGNGVSDCIDPTLTTQPSAPSVCILNRKRGRISVHIPSTFEGVQYQIVVRQRGGTTRRRTSDKTTVKFKGLSGRLRVFYKIILPDGGFSKSSPIRKFRLN